MGKKRDISGLKETFRGSLLEVSSQQVLSSASDFLHGITIISWPGVPSSSLIRWQSVLLDDDNPNTERTFAGNLSVKPVVPREISRGRSAGLVAHDVQNNLGLDEGVWETSACCRNGPIGRDAMTLNVMISDYGPVEHFDWVLGMKLLNWTFYWPLLEFEPLTEWKTHSGEQREASSADQTFIGVKRVMYSLSEALWHWFWTCTMVYPRLI